MESSPWPRANADAPVVAARFKAHAADFEVEELPVYEPAGEGDHVFFAIEKSGISTRQAVQLCARAFDVSAGSIGYAGRKDARGMTRQVLSVEHVDPERVRAFAAEGLRVLWAERHSHKLRLGHLRGNRFRVRLREVSTSGVDELRALLPGVLRRGVPNYYGAQRFGARGDTWRVGRALLRADFEEAARRIAGCVLEVDRGAIREARTAFDNGDYRRAGRLWPAHFVECAKICRALARGEDARRAVMRVDRQQLRFFVSAFQAWCFNHVLAARLGDFDRVRPGDLACVHGGSRVFEVEGSERDCDRAADGEISATGPMWGSKMAQPGAAIRALEESALEQLDESPQTFAPGPPLGPRGARRALRVALTGGRDGAEASMELGQDEHGEFVELRFDLPPGAYATAVLAEWAGDSRWLGGAGVALGG